MSMATFHSFSRLPLELRIQIWGYAMIDDRVLRVRKTFCRTEGFWSPTIVPAVTRACRESRKHCSYQKAFIITTSPRYVWVNFDSDIIQIRSWLLVEETMRDEARHLRVELVNENGLDESEDFYHRHVYQLRHFPKLESFDLLVSDGLSPQWTDYIKETYWGVCPRGNVRIVDSMTGGWIDEETSGVYQDYIDTDGGKNDDYTRIVVDYEDDEDDEDKEARMEAVKRFRMPLPRIDLDYCNDTITL